MGPQVKGPLDTYSSFTPIMTDPKSVYGQVWAAPTTTNCRVVKAESIVW